MVEEPQWVLTRWLRKPDASVSSIAGPRCVHIQELMSLGVFIYYGCGTLEEPERPNIQRLRNLDASISRINGRVKIPKRTKIQRVGSRKHNVTSWWP